MALPKASNAILSLRLRYKQKLDFASQLEIEPELPLIDGNVVGSLRKLNKMRNDFSHRLGHTVSDEEIESLYVGRLADIKIIYGDDLLRAGQDIAIKRYLFAIFNCMFPKYEKVENT